MSTKRKQHSAEFKFKVALEAAKNVKTRAEIASDYGVSGAQVRPFTNFNCPKYT